MKLDPQTARRQLIEILSDDDHRAYFIAKYTCFLLMLISGVMSVVNVITRMPAMMWSTVIFTVMNLINVLLITEERKRVRMICDLLSLEICLLFVFFLVSGEPEGFSVIWIALLAPFAMLLFGLRHGAGLTGVMFLILVFFLWIPQGTALLHNPYTASFRLRFPFLYLASCVLAIFFEIIRSMTQRELQTAQSQYAHLYTHDALTGLDNRYGLDDAMKHLGREPVGVLMLDLDLFKNVNDLYGHAAGDAVLKACANLMRKTLRVNDVIARWGGEEFVAVLKNTTIPERAAQKLLDAFRNEDILLPDRINTVRITVSIGVASARDGSTADVQELLRRADMKLYEAKQAGRNRYAK